MTTAENVHTLAGIISLLWDNSNPNITDSDIAAINTTQKLFIAATGLTADEVATAEDIVINRNWFAICNTLGN
jgi:hypothetical protein